MNANDYEEYLNQMYSLYTLAQALHSFSGCSKFMIKAHWLAGTLGTYYRKKYLPDFLSEVMEMKETK